MDNMCINKGKQKSSSLYGLHYDAWSNPDSNVCWANVGPTSDQLASLSKDRILY